MRTLAVHKFRSSEDSQALKQIEDALKLAKQINDKKEEGLCNEILN